MSDQEYYQRVIDELKSSGPIQALWLQAMVEQDGNETEAKLHYIKLRVAQLRNIDISTPIHVSTKTSKFTHWLGGTNRFLSLTILGIILLIVILVTILTEGSALAPFFYSLF